MASLLIRTTPVVGQATSGSPLSSVEVPVRQPLVSPERAIRRDVPLTNAIRRALEAGTRDFTGRPGPNYWQLQTDYTIEASLNPATQTISGQETIVIHNNSNEAMQEIVLRLDHNIVAWHTRLPGGPNGQGHRMTQRWDDTLFQPTQWYPRVAKFDDLRGWDTDVYLGPAEFYSALWAPYPFPQLTLQDGPSAGMEYPMVINSNQGAADHETAHQWWPMMVGTNET